MFPLPNIKHINNKKISKKDSYLPKIKGLTLTLSKQRFVDESGYLQNRSAHNEISFMVKNVFLGWLRRELPQKLSTHLLNDTHHPHVNWNTTKVKAKDEIGYISTVYLRVADK